MARQMSLRLLRGRQFFRHRRRVAGTLDLLHDRRSAVRKREHAEMARRAERIGRSDRSCPRQPEGQSGPQEAERQPREDDAVHSITVARRGIGMAAVHVGAGEKFWSASAVRGENRAGPMGQASVGALRRLSGR
jgi:hypothetical protein